MKIIHIFYILNITDIKSIFIHSNYLLEIWAQVTWFTFAAVFVCTFGTRTTELGVRLFRILATFAFLEISKFRSLKLFSFSHCLSSLILFSNRTRVHFIRPVFPLSYALQCVAFARHLCLGKFFRFLTRAHAHNCSLCPSSSPSHSFGWNSMSSRCQPFVCTYNIVSWIYDYDYLWLVCDYL